MRRSWLAGSSGSPVTHLLRPRSFGPRQPRPFANWYGAVVSVPTKRRSPSAGSWMRTSSDARHGVCTRMPPGLPASSDGRRHTTPSTSRWHACSTAHWSRSTDGCAGARGDLRRFSARGTSETVAEPRRDRSSRDGAVRERPILGKELALDTLPGSSRPSCQACSASPCSSRSRSRSDRISKPPARLPHR